MNKTEKEIFKYIKQKKQVKPSDIFYDFPINRQMVHRHLKKLLSNKKIIKIGSAPKVFYEIAKINNLEKEYFFNSKISKIIEQEFLYITPKGKELFGKKGFIEWCQKRGFSIQKKAQEFVKIFEKYQKIKKDGLLDASYKLKATFGKNKCADALYYFDFYSIEVFGKTKTGQQLLYAKQSQDKKRIRQLATKIKKSVEDLIKREKIDSIVFVPPTVPRTVQFMNVLEKELNLKLPKIKISKIISDIRIPQKTLKKLEDRIENATNTFLIEDNTVFQKTLIIDDAVGSGASINQIACKLKENNNSKQVIGFAITGSLNDFDVIFEV